MDNLGNPKLTDYYRKTLQGFYSVLKAKDGQIRFGFLTGVSKIGKLSVFSTLNNLRDISMDSGYSDICGISEEDVFRHNDLVGQYRGSRFQIEWDAGHCK